MAKSDEERKAEKARRMTEKMGRMPLNDVILEVQKGTISLSSVFEAIEAKVKGGK